MLMKLPISWQYSSTFYIYSQTVTLLNGFSRIKSGDHTIYVQSISGVIKVIIYVKNKNIYYLKYSISHTEN